jgi:PAS domain S-box-containing protein
MALLSGIHVPAGDDRQELFQLFVESVVDYGIFVLDPDGCVTTWNPGAQRIKGYSEREIVGKHFSVFYPPDEVAAGKPAFELREAARLGRFEDEGWRVRKDGSRFWANVIITALKDSAGVLRGFGKVTRDLTARREAEETARQLAAEQAARVVAEHADTYKRHLLAIVGHDLRNCVSVVLTAGEMLRAHVDDATRVRRRAEQVVNSARRMRGIMGIILDYTHAQGAEGIPISPREGADVHAACQRVLEDFRTLHPARRIVYECEGIPLGEWDEGRLEQVVQNLLGNALKFSPAASTVTLSWSRSDDLSQRSDLLLRVHNQGAPIPADLLPHVFEPFRSGPQEAANARESMGLGLFIVREIVRAHGGIVEVESDAEHGTTFTVSLPGRPPGRRAG